MVISHSVQLAPFHSRRRDPVVGGPILRERKRYRTGSPYDKKYLQGQPQEQGESTDLFTHKCVFGRPEELVGSENSFAENKLHGAARSKDLVTDKYVIVHPEELVGSENSFAEKKLHGAARSESSFAKEKLHGAPRAANPFAKEKLRGDVLRSESSFAKEKLHGAPRAANPFAKEKLHGDALRSNNYYMQKFLNELRDPSKISEDERERDHVAYLKEINPYPFLAMNHYNKSRKEGEEQYKVTKMGLGDQRWYNTKLGFVYVMHFEAQPKYLTWPDPSATKHFFARVHGMHGFGVHVSDCQIYLGPLKFGTSITDDIPICCMYCGLLDAGAFRSAAEIFKLENEDEPYCEGEDGK